MRQFLIIPDLLSLEVSNKQAIKIRRTVRQDFCKDDGMKKINLLPLLLMIALPMAFSSCSVIGDIFKAGMWVGIIAVVIVVALIIWIVRKVL